MSVGSERRWMASQRINRGIRTIESNDSKSQRASHFLETLDASEMDIPHVSSCHVVQDQCISSAGLVDRSQ